MKIDWIEPSARFDVTSFSNVIIDGTAGPLTAVYSCPRCATRLLFRKDHFEVRARRRLTNLPAEISAALEQSAATRGVGTADYLDWSCETCGLMARAYAESWAGGRHGDSGVDIVALAEVAGVP